MIHRSKTQPLCRYCGKPIAKETDSVYFHARELSEHERSSRWIRHIQVDKLPATKAEAQRLINSGTIAAVKRHRSGDGIDQVTTWDGESYKDDFFCNGDHAKKFGYAAARGGQVMAAWQEARRRQLKEETKA